MTIERAESYIKRHEKHIDRIASEGNPIGRALTRLYSIYRNDPQNAMAVSVLLMALEEYMNTFDRDNSASEESIH